MASTKGLLLSAIGKLVLRDTRVTAVTPIGEHLRTVTLEGAALRDIAWTPGDKIQVLLPSRDVRTYTPMSWDERAGITELLVFDHGDSPGSAWGRRVKPGDTCRFVGPQRSLRRLAKRPAVLFGDETSFAVASALARAVPDRPLASVFEVASSTEAQVALDALKLADYGTCVAIDRAGSDRHLAQVVEQLQHLLAANPGAELVLTGRAQSIQGVRAKLRETGSRPHSATKAYWSVGKTGLD